MTPGPFLAVDAGNSKTHALLVDDAGHLLGVGSSGTGDIYTGERDAIRQVRLAVEGALGASVAGATIRHSAFRLAGVDWPEDALFWRDVVEREWRLRGTMTFLNDGFAAIRLASYDGVGLAVSAGTHSAFAGRGPAGSEFGMNMWAQHDMGAYGLGLHAFRAVALALLGMGPHTTLVEALSEHFGYADGEQLVHAAKSRHPTITASDYAKAAPVVSAAALDGDPVAARIVTRQAVLFAQYAANVAAKVGFSTTTCVPIAVNGSVARAADSPLGAAIIKELPLHIQGADVHVSTSPPVAGAALDALGEAGIVVTDKTVLTLLNDLAAAGIT